MNEDERLRLCGTITLAATKLGMKIRPDKQDQRFHFYDPVAQKVISGESNKDAKEALFSACKTLQNYLNG